MQNPILFLDIDGVMNTTSSCLRHRSGEVFTPSAVGALQMVMRETKCVVVITSTRRITGQAAMKALFTRNCLIAGAERIIGVSPCVVSCDTDDLREDEIEKWIDDHNFYGNFAILDDKPLSGPLRRHLVLTDHDTGLTPPLAARVIALLMGLLAV